MSTKYKYDTKLTRFISMLDDRIKLIKDLTDENNTKAGKVFKDLNIGFSCRQEQVRLYEKMNYINYKAPII